MKNQTYANTIDALLSDNRYIYDEQLDASNIVELGFIQHIDKGRADVRTFRIAGNSVVVYRNVEVLYIGGATGGWDIIPPSTLCLLIRPNTSIPDTKDMMTNTGVRSYNRSGMKAIPLANTLSPTVHFGMDISGYLTIKSDNYCVAFRDDSVGVSFNGVPIVDVQDGKIEADLGGLLHYSIGEGSSTKTQYDEDGKEQYKDVLESTGEHTIYAGAGEDEDEWNTTIKVADEGEVTLSTVKSISLSVGEDEDTSISIDEDRNVTYSDGVHTITLKPDDKEGSVESDSGKLTISDGNTTITLDGSSSCEVSMNSGTLTLTNGVGKIEMDSSATTINGHLKVLP